MSIQKQTKSGPYRCSLCRVTWPESERPIWPAEGFERKTCQSCEEQIAALEVEAEIKAEKHRSLLEAAQVAMGLAEQAEWEAKRAAWAVKAGRNAETSVEYRSQLDWLKQQ
jgi:hypothetical protein